MKYIILPERLSYSPAFSVEPAPVTSLYQILHTMPDPRRAQGKRHPLPVVLILAILAICSGADSYQAIKEWAVNYQEELKKQVPFLARHTPDAATFFRVFSRLNIETFEKVLGKWIQQIICLEDNEGIALDGKAIGGSGLHLVAAFAHQARAVLFQKGEKSKGKELVAASAILEKIPVRNHIVTGDALFTQRSLCSQVAKKKGGYLFTVKANQKNLQGAIKVFFEEPPFKTQIKTDTNLTIQKGRVEKRMVKASADPDMLAYLDWPGLTHIWRCLRERTDKKTGRVTTEIAIGVARLLNSTNSAKQINTLIRGHWQVENRLFRQRDVVFNEDRSTVRKRHGPQVMAALRNLVTTIFHRGAVRSFRTARRRFAAKPEELFAFLGLPAYAKAYAI